MLHRHITDLYSLLSRNSVMAVRGFRVQLTDEALCIVSGGKLVGSWRQDGENLVLMQQCRAASPAIAHTVDEAVHQTMQALNDYCG